MIKNNSISQDEDIFEEDKIISLSINVEKYTIELEIIETLMETFGIDKNYESNMD